MTPSPSDTPSTPLTLGSNAYYVVPVRTAGTTPAPDDGAQRCQYFRLDWRRVQGQPMNSFGADGVVLMQPPVALAAPHIASPDEADPDAVLFAGVAKTLRRDTDLPKTFSATPDGPDRIPVIQVPVLPATTRGLILVFARPAAGDQATRLTATTDPEISNSTNL